jgi:hypothetical protein
MARVYWGKRLLGLSPSRWLADVLGRCTITGLAAAALGAVPTLVLAPSVARLGLTIAVSICTTALAGWLVCLTPGEREYIACFAQKAAAILCARQTRRVS